MALIPEVIVPGAMKAGSTSVLDWIGSLPDFNTGKIKEPDLFSAGVNGHVLRLRSLLNYGLGTNDVRVDGTTEYGKFRRSEDTAELVSQFVPDARILFLVRDPVDRSLSHYRHNVDRGLEDRLDPVDAMTVESDYVLNSLYRACIAPWLRHFADRVVVLNTDLLFAGSSEERERLRLFLGLSETSNMLFEQKNAAGSVTNVRAARRLTKTLPGYEFLRPLIPTRVRRAAVQAAGVNERRADKISVKDDSEARKVLNQLLNEEISWMADGCELREVAI